MNSLGKVTLLSTAVLGAAYASEIVSADEAIISDADVQQSQAEHNAVVIQNESLQTAYDQSATVYETHVTAVDTQVAEYPQAEVEVVEISVDTTSVESYQEYNNTVTDLTADNSKAIATYEREVAARDNVIAENAASKASYEQAVADYNAQNIARIDELNAYEEKLAQDTYNVEKASFDKSKAEYDKAKSEYDAAKAAYDKDLATYEADKKAHEESVANTQKAQAEYDKRASENKLAQDKYDAEKATYDKAVADAKAEVMSKLVDYKDRTFTVNGESTAVKKYLTLDGKYYSLEKLTYDQLKSFEDKGAKMINMPVIGSFKAWEDATVEEVEKMLSGNARFSLMNNRFALGTIDADTENIKNDGVGNIGDNLSTMRIITKAWTDDEYSYHLHEEAADGGGVTYNGNIAGFLTKTRALAYEIEHNPNYAISEAEFKKIFGAEAYTTIGIVRGNTAAVINQDKPAESLALSESIIFDRYTGDTWYVPEAAAKEHKDYVDANGNLNTTGMIHLGKGDGKYVFIDGVVPADVKEIAGYKIVSNTFSYEVPRTNFNGEYSLRTGMYYKTGEGPLKDILASASNDAKLAYTKGVEGHKIAAAGYYGRTGDVLTGTHESATVSVAKPELKLPHGDLGERPADVGAFTAKKPELKVSDPGEFALKAPVKKTVKKQTWTVVNELPNNPYVAKTVPSVNKLVLTKATEPVKPQLKDVPAVLERTYQTEWVTTTGDELATSVIDKVTYKPGSFDKYRLVESVVDKEGHVTHVFERVYTTDWVTVDGDKLQDQVVDTDTKDKGSFDGYEFVETKTDDDGNVSHIFKTIEKPVAKAPLATVSKLAVQVRSEAVVKLAESSPTKAISVEQSEKVLPNTGDVSGLASVLGLTMSAIGLTGLSRRKRD